MVLVSGQQVSLVDWRGFEAHDAKAISGAGCWFSGGSGCLRARMAGAIRGDGNGTDGGCGTEHALPDGGAGADCDCVVSVPGFHRGARWTGNSAAA